ncbi:hypothetical protein H263_03226 [Brachyspira hampsonii 30599]|nr:hypothetical protein H263_03226 [Brachyspira hampsonii 30599]
MIIFLSVNIDSFIEVVETIINIVIAIIFTMINITATTEPLIYFISPFFISFRLKIIYYISY